MDTSLKPVSRPPASARRLGTDKVAELRRLIESKNDALVEHEYFRLCRSNQMSRSQLLDVVKQLYCFSVFFERLLARRIAEYSSTRDPRVIQIARVHMREEIGHAQLFRDCLEANGFPAGYIDQLSPAMFTKAMFGYLSVTIQHENEYVSNVAIMQVMESIGYHFFSATLEVMKAHDMLADAMAKHSEDDEDHASLGLELAAQFDRQTMMNCRRIVEDIYRLMGFVLDEWLGTSPQAGAGISMRKRRSSRPLPRRAADVS